MSDQDPPPPEATLTDVLEALVTSFSRARVQADIRAAQVSQMYLKHDMLRGMPVPRMRLNRVQVNLPLVVTSVRKGIDFKLADHRNVAHQIAEALEREVDGLRKGLLSELNHALEDGKAILPDTEAGLLIRRLRNSLGDALSFLEANSGAVSGGANAGITEVPPAPGVTAGPTPDAAAARTFRRILRSGLEAVMEPLRDGRALVDATTELGLRAACAAAVERAIRHLLGVHCSELIEPATEELEAFYPILLGEKEPPRGEGDKPLNGLEGRYAEQLYAALLKAIPDLIARLGAQAGKAALEIPSSPPEIMIAPHTVDVKNEGTPDTVTRVNMVMTEEGLEWVAESAGEGNAPNWKLTPE